MRVPLAKWPEAGRTLYRTFGGRGLALRALHEGRRTVGRFRSAPRFAAGASPPASWLRVDEARLAAATDREVALERAGRVLDGQHQAYRWVWRDLPTDAHGWLEHPMTGQTAAADRPWWEVAHLDPAFGDIKDLWEPARFAWLYDLVRAYVLTRDDRYAQAAVLHIGRFAESSPVFRGPHWSCGQETAIRAAALLYAEANLAGAPSMDDAARALLRTLLAASGERIADAIGYAVSQRNNHAISEAAGLVLLGARFRGDHPEAAQWLGDGHDWLERLIVEQFAPDGWYIQHSFTYQRLALEQCVLAEHGLRAVGRHFSTEAVSRLTAAADLLATLVETETGIVPNYGANDGAFVHPATLAAYRDFRPVLSAVCATWQHPLPESVPLDSEVLAWLGLPNPPRREAIGDGVWTGPSGWAVVRKGPMQVFLRAGHYTSRPAQLDPLHIDVRHGTQEIVVDAGTYAYNAPPPWRNGLIGAAVHNGPLLDEREPGVRGPRFLWYLWPEAAIVSVEDDGEAFTVTAERSGQVRRHVVVTASEVEVHDTVLAGDADGLRVRWLLHPDADPAHVDSEGGTWRTAEEAGTLGWFSPRYGERMASRTLDVRRPAIPGTTLTTFIRVR